MFEKKNAQTLLRLFSALSDEEKEKFLAGVNGADEETPEEAQDAAEDAGSTSEGEDTTPEENAAESHENEARSEKETAPATEEPAAEEEPAEEEADAAEDAAPAEEVKKAQEVDEALLARITALEELVAKLTETMGDGKETDEGKTFGTSPSAPDGNDDALAEDDRIMRRYYAKQGYRH